MNNQYGQGTGRPENSRGSMMQHQNKYQLLETAPVERGAHSMLSMHNTDDQHMQSRVQPIGMENFGEQDFYRDKPQDSNGNRA